MLTKEVEGSGLNTAGYNILIDFEKGPYTKGKRWAGPALEAYEDMAGVWTIGYGHTGRSGPPPVEEGMVITEKEAFAILRSDVATFSTSVLNLLKRPANANQFSAFVCLAFNIGTTNFAASTALKRFNAGESNAKVTEAMAWWNKVTVQGEKVPAKGLKRRRAAEANLFSRKPNEEDNILC